MFIPLDVHCGRCGSIRCENFSYSEHQGQVTVSGTRCRSCGHERVDNIGDKMGGRTYQKQDGKRYF